MEKENKESQKKVIVIGAGPGGLTTAMILAHRGFEVEDFEKSDRVGGRNAELRVGDFRFDTGPTFLMMKFVLDEMFREAGHESSEYLKFIHLDPMYRLIFPDISMDISDDREKMKQSIAEHFPGQENNLDVMFEREAKRFEYIYPCLQKDYSSFKEFFDPIFLKAIPHIPLGQSIFDYLGKYFDLEKLRLAFTFQSKYLGMSPWECPGFFIILPYIEHTFGIWHVEGGLSEISHAMAKVIEEKGGKIHLNMPVKELLLDGKRTVGIVLENGKQVIADDIVINADFAHAMNTLVPEGVLKKYAPEKLAKKRYSCSTFMLYLGIDKIYTELPHHTIVFADKYRENVDDIFERLEISEDTSLYIRNSSINDTTVAPTGKSGLYVLVPVANNKSSINWETEKDAFRERILDTIIARAGLSDLREHIEVERMITPADWEESGVYLGATFNLSHSLDQMLYLRPHNRFEELENCYLVGGGTHPGSGLPTIYQSGRIVANMISKKEHVIFTSPQALDAIVKHRDV